MVSFNRLSRELGVNLYEVSSTFTEGRPKRIRRCPTDKYADTDIKTTYNYSTDFDSNIESEQWNRFYSDKKLSNTPFYGLSTDDSAILLYKILSKSNFKLSSNDIIVEIGHGKHPLVDKIREIFNTCNIFIGVEFSSMAIKEAIANYTVENLKNTQFLTPSNINYYKSDGNFDGNIVYSTIGNQCILKRCCSRLVIGRCVLDYITSRLLTSAGIVDWDQDPRIPNSVITMFNAFTNTLSDDNSAIVFIEPLDKIKIHDHILTLFKVLCISTLVEINEARFLKLHRIITNNNMGIICYMIIKTEEVAKNYEEIHKNFTNVTKNIFKSDKGRDSDWLLPTKMPCKWSSNNQELFDVLTSFN